VKIKQYIDESKLEIDYILNYPTRGDKNIFVNNNIYNFDKIYINGTIYEDFKSINYNNLSNVMFATTQEIIKKVENINNTIDAIQFRGSNKGNYIVYDGSTFIVNNTNRLYLGINSGFSNQNSFSIAIGVSAGSYNQNIGGIAIGYQAGYTNIYDSFSSNDNIAIGSYAGNLNQNPNCIAIGYEAGKNNQKYGAISIGLQAGYKNQGKYSIAIGAYTAGDDDDSMHDNSIILNASGSYVQTTGNNRTFINPIRSVSPGSIISHRVLLYDSQTFEITSKVNSSDIRIKNHIEPINTLIPYEFLKKITPVNFKFSYGDTNNIHHGFLADEFIQDDILNEYNIVNKEKYLIEDIQLNCNLYNGIVTISESDKTFKLYGTTHINWDKNQFGDTTNIPINTGIKINQNIEFIYNNINYKANVIDILSSNKIQIKIENNYNQKHNTYYFTDNINYNIHVLGNIYDDFKSIKYDNLTNVMFYTIQELIKKVEYQNNEINTLKNDINYLKNIIQNL